MSAPPLSLYVHLPWCVRKCPYCDFNSYSGGDAAQRERYLRALVKDIAGESRRVGTRNIESVFLGGGTPSLFTPAELTFVLDEIASHFVVAADAEITMEANPGTVECGDLAGYREAGVNRLSLGAQSFDQDRLTVLGRVHAVDDIGRSVGEAVEAGFENINIDIMYALPGQQPADAVGDIEQAAALGPSHISWYHLTLEPNTVFHARPPAGLPDEDGAAAIQDAGESRLADLGYERYEVSAYARDGQRCRHNLNYWSFGDYIGVGAGAHGKLTSPEAVERQVKTPNPQQYMQTLESGRDPGIRSQLRSDDLQFEFMLNALRLTEGFTEQLYVDRTRLPVGPLRERLDQLLRRGLVSETATGYWRPTERGQQFLNELQAHFLPD